MNRRQLLQVATAGIALTTLARGALASVASARQAKIDARFHAVMDRLHVPGAAAAVFDKTGVVFASAYGFANIATRRPVSLDSLQNIGSISKTFTATAVMQLAERGLVDLDNDVSEYLPFELRNPKHPNTAITARQLFNHSSSLRDGDAYARNYACGDPRLGLAAWVRAFFLPGGAHYDEARNFEDWPPGTRTEYCNVSWSVAALIVEYVSGVPFERYCDRNIFTHLGMHSTAWMLADIDHDRHVTPYSWVEETSPRSKSWGGIPLGVITPDGPTHDRELAPGLHENCLYNHPNYPDGFLRTCVRDLVPYLRAYANGGSLSGRRILRRETVAEMLTPSGDGDTQYGICWQTSYSLAGEPVWGHSGSDPGIRTQAAILPGRNAGGAIITNSDSDAPQELMQDMLRLALEI